MLSNHSIKFQTFHVSYIVKTRHPCFSYIPVYIYITKRTITIYKEKEKHLPILGPFPTVPDFSPFSSWLSLEQLPREGPLLPHSIPRDLPIYIRQPIPIVIVAVSWYRFHELFLLADVIESP